jgi:transcriptional regulator with XRE-family HTH domain
MSIKQDLSPIDSTDADRLRALLESAGLSQRAAAKILNIEERTMREWCAGKGKPPASVFRALSPRLTHTEYLLRTIESKEQRIEALRSGRITGMGYGPGPSDPQSVDLEIDRLLKQNEQNRALVRVDQAFHRRQAAYLEHNAQSLPHGTGVPTDANISEIEAAEKEFRVAEAELHRITRGV